MPARQTRTLWPSILSIGATPLCFTSRWRGLFVAPSRTVKQVLANEYPRQEISPPSYGVNTNTVLRALRVLRDEGVIEMGRGRSIRVTGRPDRSVVATKMKELLDVARQHGYRKEDLMMMLEKLPGR